MKLFRSTHLFILLTQTPFFDIRKENDISNPFEFPLICESENIWSQHFKFTSTSTTFFDISHSEFIAYNFLVCIYCYPRISEILYASPSKENAEKKLTGKHNIQDKLLSFIELSESFRKIGPRKIGMINCPMWDIPAKQNVWVIKIPQYVWTNR